LLLQITERSQRSSQYHSHRGLISRRDLQLGVFDAELGRGNRQLGKSIDPSRLLIGHEVGGIEVGDLRRDIARIRGGIKGGDFFNSGSSGLQRLPIGVSSNADGGNGAQTSYHHATPGGRVTVHAHVICSKFHR
jgi:hypothetical protein